jgi:hypothetical protein
MKRFLHGVNASQARSALARDTGQGRKFKMMVAAILEASALRDSPLKRNTYRTLAKRYQPGPYLMVTTEHSDV